MTCNCNKCTKQCGCFNFSLHFKSMFVKMLKFTVSDTNVPKLFGLTFNH